MKTIAVSIDDETAALLDGLSRARKAPRSRSSVVRQAVRELADRERLRAAAEQDRAALKSHKALARELRLLVRDQAKP